MDESGYEVIAVIFIVAAIIYEIPAIIAFMRGHPNRWVILVLCTTFGATGIVWLGCLIWAFMAVHVTKDPTGTNGGESGLNLAANDVVRVRFDPQQQPTLPPPLQGAFTARPDAIERLERLKKLLDDGAIDREQFERMRNVVVADS